MTIGVLLMTYGVPRDESELPAYLARVRGGREPTAELVAEMARRYRAIGGSPLVRITEAQAAALERELGAGFSVRAAMRFSEPSIERVAHELASQAHELVGIVLSPQWSDVLMSGYERALADAASVRGLRWRMIRGWHTEPAFVELVAELLRAGLEGMNGPAILLTAHSVPRRVYDAEPGYIEQLRTTAAAIARAAGLRPEDWRFAYQSAGHTQEEWLRPDLVELFPEIAASGATSVLVVPVQFLAEHLEILYDLDIAARAQAENARLEYHRIAMPNDRPELARALAGVVRGAAVPG